MSETETFQCAKTTFTVLEETVRAGSGNLEIVKHPMIQKMIEVKWRQFGKRGSTLLDNLECNKILNCH